MEQPEEKSMEWPQIFVYGTLRNGSCHPLALALRRASRPVRAAWLWGSLYDLGDYPGLRIFSETEAEGQGGTKVYGDLFAVEPHLWPALLTQLDAYEGCDSRLPQPWEYVRVRASVCAQGQWVEAWVYQYQWPLQPDQRMASGEWGLGLG